MIKYSLKIVLIFCLFGMHSCEKIDFTITNVNLSPITSVEHIEQKVSALLNQMTLEEKIGQMNQYNGFWDLTGPAPSSGNAAK